MNLSWNPVIFLDISGSVLMLLLSWRCAVLSRQHANKKPDDIFRNYLFLFTLAIVFFACSRSFGHLIKQILLLNDMEPIWKHISPFSGAINSITFVVIFAFGLYSRRFQKVHLEMEYYKNNLEEMITVRTEELEKAKNTLENILNNSNPINITDINYDLIQANAAYYKIWPRPEKATDCFKCFESRPGTHCHTADCPLAQIIAGSEIVFNEVSKEINGERKDYIVTAKPFRDIDGKLIGMVESFQDITHRKQAETAIRESENRFRQIFATNPDPVILATLTNGKIIDVNNAFIVATGIQRIDALGYNSEELGLWAEKKTREPFREMLQKHGEVNNFEASFSALNGETKTGLLSARILKLNNEPCILTVIRDVTREKAAEHALIEMDQKKSEFISAAAHELNTPLCAIMGFTELLLNPDMVGSFTEEQKQGFLSEVYDRGESLSRIIDDLLDFSRSESGQAVTLDLKQADLVGILNKTIAYYQSNNLERSFTLELPEETVNSTLLVDRHRIIQVLENLMSNAVKYSSNGSEIVVKSTSSPAGWEISIEDSGIGMSQEQLERVFDKFYRVDSSDTGVSGLGLGMSITRQIVESHGGMISVESTLGTGTRVCFTLPAQ